LHNDLFRKLGFTFWLRDRLNLRLHKGRNILYLFLWAFRFLSHLSCKLCCEIIWRFLNRCLFRLDKFSLLLVWGFIRLFSKYLYIWFFLILVFEGLTLGFGIELLTLFVEFFWRSRWTDSLVFLYPLAIEFATTVLARYSIINYFFLFNLCLYNGILVLFLV
jgi:hypothetical protein